MQTVQVRHWYGFGLSLLTAVLWGMLPVFLKLCLEVMDAITITWYRFTLAALFVGWLLHRTKALPPLRAISRSNNMLIAMAAIGLIANYVLYLQGLHYLNPETAQVLIQLAPFLLMVGGIIIYKERFNRYETFGALVLLAGLLLFFNDRLALLFSSLGQYTLGVLMVIVAAITWAAYALSQKHLLKALTAKQLTLLLYCAGCIVLLPFSNLNTVLNMNTLQLAALIFCCANTVVAYGAFTEALHVWHASKVSAVIALAPLFTFLSMEAAVRIWPSHFVPSDLDQWAYIGAGLVMMGSMLAAAGKAK
ncbi:DMT family transporter [Aliiglaciecola sp. CAU 1673]|uniref:DMT family transporter n=1 Tax=Aliiglaciecola sp. CAU 1673 TaxID=3032595 RepID=UPI0023DA10CD|nr:DMT family transporter [Aliiglaciecola sp. CAU 1673]MDF2178771.1 DMT family transporter [Aliiglaciecola sp. CAU 1673]